MNIYKAMAAVMEDCGYVAKGDKNIQQGYKYRGIDAVMNALNPALRKNHVFVVPEVLDQTREERTTNKGALLIYSVVTVRYTFYADDGSYVQATVIGEGMDSGDKSTNKAMSAAFKYACFQAFCIPTEEMQDSEKDSPEPEPKQDSKVARNKPADNTEDQKQQERRMRRSYPARDVMVREIIELSKPDALRQWMNRLGVNAVEEAPDASIIALYNYYHKAG